MLYFTKVQGTLMDLYVPLNGPYNWPCEYVRILIPILPEGHFRGKGIFVLCQIDNKQNENSSASEHVRKDQFGSKKVERVRAGKSG